MNIRPLTIAALLISSVALCQEGTAPATLPAVRADAVDAATAPAAQEDVDALRQEIARLRTEVQTLQNGKPAEPVRADMAPTAAPRPWQTPQPAEPVTKTLPERPAAARPVPVVQLPPYQAVQISALEVRSIRRGGSPGIYVVSNVTLRGVPDVPFTYQAMLVTRDEQVHTNARSQPYIATREVRTGDDEDTDDYGVFLDLGDLFSSRPPEDLYVQVRIVDLQGNVVAKSGLYTFARPWR